MPSLLKAVAALPMVLFSLSAHSQDVPSSSGLQVTVSSFLLLAAWTNIIKDIRCGATSAADVERHLEQGKKMLAAGQLADALSHYHLAVEGDPSNYLTYFRRATVYLAMGKSKAALPDLDKVLELKPDFNAARMQRANVKLKQGKLTEAKVDYEEVTKRDPNSNEARSHLDEIPSIESAIQQARQHFNNANYMAAIDLLARPVELCPWDAELHELRAGCYELVGDFSKAILDIRPTTKLIPDNTAGYLKLSTLLYSQGYAEDSLKEIRECLKLDADHKGCHTHYKKVKKLVQQMQAVDSARNDKRWDDCISKTEQMTKTESQVLSYIQLVESHMCHCHSQGKNIEEAMKYCNVILEKDPNNVEALCDRAEAHILNEEFEEAVNDYKKAEGVNGELQRVREGLQKAQKLLKQSQKRDYYKILGVKRHGGHKLRAKINEGTAQKTEITKAYRKLAAQWHPDQYHGDDKGKAEKMFIDIAAAKEVLTDPEKRAKFDQGEDPLDPEQQAGGGGPQWHQGFNPFGQGGFQFKFHFN